MINQIEETDLTLGSKNEESKKIKNFKPSRSLMSSLNDSFESNVKRMNKKTKYTTCRQYCVKHVFLSRRTKRMQVNQIQNALSLDFQGLCSHNIYSFYILMLLLGIYTHVIWFALCLLSTLPSSQLPSALKPFSRHYAFEMVMLPLLLLFSIYPLALSIISLTSLIFNFLFGREYETVYSWHRNSIYRLVQVIVFCSNVLPSLKRLHSEASSSQDFSKIFDIVDLE